MALAQVGASANADTQSNGTRANWVPKVHCDGGNTRRTMLACLSSMFTEADDEMNALYKEQMAWLGANNTDYDWRTLLKDAQRSWIVYRDKSCTYEEGPMEARGRDDALTAASCQIQMTKDRIEVLERYLQCHEGGCPGI